MVGFRRGFSAPKPARAKMHGKRYLMRNDYSSESEFKYTRRWPEAVQYGMVGFGWFRQSTLTRSPTCLYTGRYSSSLRIPLPTESFPRGPGCQPLGNWLAFLA